MYQASGGWWKMESTPMSLFRPNYTDRKTGEEKESAVWWFNSSMPGSGTVSPRRRPARHWRRTSKKRRRAWNSNANRSRGISVRRVFVHWRDNSNDFPARFLLLRSSIPRGLAPVGAKIRRGTFRTHLWRPFDRCWRNSGDVGFSVKTLAIDIGCCAVDAWNQPGSE
jgi:hypothetical protein